MMTDTHFHRWAIRNLIWAVAPKGWRPKDGRGRAATVYLEAYDPSSDTAIFQRLLPVEVQAIVDALYDAAAAAGRGVEVEMGMIDEERKKPAEELPTEGERSARPPLKLAVAGITKGGTPTVVVVRPPPMRMTLPEAQAALRELMVAVDCCGGEIPTLDPLPESQRERLDT